ncbi:MAG TPA: glycosyltransferase family 39 protein [Acidimicrobiales bacterium]|nr:glycosyltransferase family 39 protein [Acidimicrobiales bacterium]
MVAAPAPATAPHRGAESPDAGTAGGDTRLPPLALAGIAVAVIAGIALRLYSRSPLWLDEALTVNISRLPLSQLTEALRHDGAPPLFYVLLHVWTGIFGPGDVAARSLSAVFSVAALPLMYLLGRRLGGKVVGVAALVLAAVSPFAMRYATEARMYSLVALLVAAGWLVLVATLDHPKPGRLVALGLIAGLLLLTHYWSFYLVGVVGIALAVSAWRHPDRRRPRVLAIVAIGVGCLVLFAPWLPTFVYQRAHTGTPWGVAPSPIEVATIMLIDFGGGPKPEGQAGAFVLAALTALALFGRAVDRRHVDLDLATRPGIRAEAGVAGVALLLAVIVGAITRQGFASRYTSIAFPVVVLVAAYGTRTLLDRRIVAGFLALATLLGCIGGIRNVVTPRTQARQAADAITANGGRPGDLVVYCPDQVGPDVSRELPAGYQQVTFPDLGDPHFVNWVDYAARMKAASPQAFAEEALRRGQGHTIWLVWMGGYRTLGQSCEDLTRIIGPARPDNAQVLESSRSIGEKQSVWRYGP